MKSHLETNRFAEWAAEQLSAAEIVPSAGMRAQTVRNCVLALSRTFGDMNFTVAGDGVRDEVLTLFGKLARGESLPVAGADLRWVSARQKTPSIGETARVRSTAFAGDQGILYNGRLGRIIFMRNGRIGIAFEDGKTPEQFACTTRELELRY
jgi:hypothetical protein